MQGDSLSANATHAWQNIVTARTGMTLYYEDARQGRHFDQAFECYGAFTPGAPLGAYHIANYPVGCDYLGLAGKEGNTLAQNVANVDILVIELGTNDQTSNIPLGSPGDAVTAGTLTGNMRWVAETYLTANPYMRVVFVTPQYNRYNSPYTATDVAQAMMAYGKSMGLPVIDMNALGGVNAITAPYLLEDQLHPSTAGFTLFYGPVIAQALTQLF